MNCPSCQTDNTQRLQIIYEGGTHNISLTSQSVGMAGGSNEGTGAGLVTTSTSGTSISQLAQKCAPPPKKSQSWPITLGTIGVFMFLFSNGLHIMFSAFGLIGLALFLAKRNRAYNTTVWPPLYATWQRSWHCNRCGTIYA